MKVATIVTNRGTIRLKLFADKAPKTVANFEKLANSGFYDGVKFHRVIPGFVVQGGDPQSRDLPAGDPRIGSGGPRGRRRGRSRSHGGRDRRDAGQGLAEQVSRPTFLRGVLGKAQ